MCLPILMGGITMDFKQELANKATTTTKQPAKVKLTTNMSIADLIRALEPEIKRALPSVLTPERFTRMALNALSNTPKLAECSQMSFIAALMNSAQLGLEPNTPLGQCYLIPFKNNKTKQLECQFQIGYKGMIDLVYRNDSVQTIQAQTVYANDEFQYELGLNPKLHHKPVINDRGEPALFYAYFKLENGGFGFEVMSKDDIIEYANKYSQGINSSYSPWKNNFEDMAKKTVIKRVLKYAPLKADDARAIATDGTVKTEIGIDMTEIQGEDVFDNEEEYSEEAFVQ